MLAGTLILFRGLPALRLAWFPLFFLMFAIPLAHDLVLASPGRLKAAVSAVAADLLYELRFTRSDALVW